MFLLNCFCDGCGACALGSGGAADGERWKRWASDAEPHWLMPPPGWKVLLGTGGGLLACSDVCALKLSQGAPPIGAQAAADLTAETVALADRAAAAIAAIAARGTQ